MQLGAFTLPNALFVAPMAGVTDRPFRKLCKRLGAGYAVSEMVTSRPDLQDSLKTSRYNIDRGAQIIDINMGCPAKKVCNKWAGSALMQDEALAIEIVQAVVAACEPHGVPVTLKMRTGWCASVRNAPTLALAAEAAGVQMLTVHGRTREQGYKGQAEHDTVAHIKSRVRIPVVANGDIDSPEQAREVLRRTGADAIMVGRAAQGRPWIFREIAHFLATGEHLPPPDLADVRVWLLDHLHDHYDLYGESTGVRSARKHLGWYAQSLPLPPGAAALFRSRVNAVTTVEAQLRCVSESLDEWSSGETTTTTPSDNWKLAA